MNFYAKTLNKRTGVNMIPNTDPDTGIRYGVASLLRLADWVFDEFFQHGTNESYEEALSDWRKEHPEADDEEFEYEGDEDKYSLEIEGMTLGLSYLGGSPLVWVFKSPYVTRARQCSPCIPFGGDLDNQDQDGVECYTLPPEWFR